MMNTETFVFGRVVEGLRTYRGLTQAELASAAGVSNTALSRIERGESSPTFLTLQGLARGLDMPAGRLVDAYDQSLAGAQERLKKPEASAQKPLKELVFRSAVAASVFTALAQYIDEEIT